MPYIDRDANQRIVAGYETPQWNAQEWIGDSDPEWAQFRSERWEEKMRRLRRELTIVDRILSQALIDLVNMLRKVYGLSDEELPEPLIQQIAFKQRLNREIESAGRPVAVSTQCLQDG